MDINKILSADILDIIFEGKNKQYGAYDLRKTYNSRLTRALLITLGIGLLIFVSSILINVVGKNKHADIDVVDTQMAEIKKNDAPPPPPPPPPPPKAPPPPEINQIKFTPPKIVKDEEVEKPIETITEKTAVSDVTVHTDNTDAVVKPVEDKGTQVAAPVHEDDENKVFTKVEIEAGFPGGDAAWARYLQKGLNANAPVDAGAPAGTYKVIVKFIVSKDGSISDVTPETSFGYGMEEEAVKIIKKGPRWTPAVQNGRNVNAYRRQPITFVVEEPQ